MYFPLETTSLTRLIVIDFDGVIADSDILANAVLAEFVTDQRAPKQWLSIFA